MFTPDLIRSLHMRNIVEFIPYVFQILALLLDLHPQPISDDFLELLPGIVAPPLWENQGK